MSANYRNPNFLLPNELNQSINPDLSVDRHSLYSMDFDGTTTRVNTNYVPPADWFNSGFSISSWVYPTSPNNDTIIGSYSVGRFYWRLYDTNKWWVGFGNWNNSTTVNSVTSNEWQHVCLTYTPSDTTIRFYRNGSPDGSIVKNLTGLSMPSASFPLFVGANNQFTPQAYFSGKLDELALFNTALTQGQVQALADNKNSPVNIMALPTKPVVYYPLGEEARNTGYLSSGSDVSGSEWQFPNQSIQSTVVDFNTQDYIEYPHVSIDNSFTVSTWVKTTDTQQYGNLFSSSNQFGGGPNVMNNWKLTRHYNRARFNASNSSNGFIFDVNTGVLSSDPNLSDGNWHHVLAIWDGTTNANGVKIFFDGVLRGLDTASSTAINTDSSIPIRAGSSISNFDFIGEQSNQQIWNTALTYGSASADGDVAGGDVAAIYNNGSPYSGTQPQLSNLKAWYKLNAANSSYAPHSANFNSALSFDGQNDTMTFSNFNSLAGLNTFSVSFWANFTTFAGYDTLINHYSTIGIRAQVLSDKIDFRWQASDGTNVIATSPNTITTGAWKHYVCTYDNIDFKLYENGSLVRTTNEPSKSYISTSNENLLMGKYWFGGRFFDGLLSNVSVFDTALDASAISTLYNNGTPETSISGTPENWWKLNAGGTTITDYGSGGNNGTNNGATLVSSPVAVEQWVFTDSAGSNDGTSTTLPISALVRSDLQFESPYSNFSLYFDGVGDYLTSNNVPAQLNTVSLSIWVKRDGSQQNHAGVFGVRNPGVISGNYGVCWDLAFNTSTNKIEFRVGDTSNSYDTAIQNSAMVDDTWTHVVGVADGTNIFLYINGSKQTNTGTYTSPIVTPATKIHIGAQGSSPESNEFKGMLDEAAIFNYGLSEAQVNQIYNNGLAANLTSLSPINWWRLGEDAYFVNNDITIPNQITGGDSCTGSGTQTSMLAADAPGSYGSGSGVNLDIVDRVGEAPGTSPINVGNSQSYNMIPDDRHGYVPGYTPAMVNNAASMDFDGVNDYIDLGSDTSLNVGGDLTISAWVYVDAHKNFNFIISKFTDASNRNYELYVRNEGNVTFVSNSNSTNSTTTIPINTWRHVAVTVQSGVTNGTKFYFNGTLDTTTGTTTVVSQTNATTIGRRSTGSYNFNGKLDEVAIFNYALTPRQIKEDIYNASKEVDGVKKTADLNNNSKLTAPVAWYRMGD